MCDNNMETKYLSTATYSPGWTCESNHQIGKILFLRGLPRCGKSTFCERWLQNNDGVPKVIVCGDDFRLSTYGQEYCDIAEASYGLTVFAAIRALVKKYLVLFDETNSSEFSLRRIFEIDPQAQYVTLNVDWRQIMENNRKTKQISIQVFERIRNNLNDIDPEVIRRDYL